MVFIERNVVRKAYIDFHSDNLSSEKVAFSFLIRSLNSIVLQRGNGFKSVVCPVDSLTRHGMMSAGELLK